jgi:hypothetical protein
MERVAVGREAHLHHLLALKNVKIAHVLVLKCCATRIPVPQLGEVQGGGS